MKSERRHGNTARLADFSDGRDENNLAEFPLALLTDRVPPGIKTLEFEDTVTDWSTGQVITRRVCMTGSDKFGLPTPKDEDVLLALIQLSKIANNCTSPEVWFTKHQVIELLGWENRGWAYDRVEESLHRWKGISLHYWNAWRDKKRGTWCNSEAIGVIEYFKLTDGRCGRKSGEEDGRSRFVWNKILFESFQAGYLKPLDFATYRMLERPAAKRAYRFLDKRFHHQPTWEFELRQLACEKLGFSRSYDTGQLKERVRPALSELEKVGFIEPAVFRKRRPKEWTVAVEKKRPRVASAEANGGETTLLAKLVGHGVEISVAKTLVAEFPAEVIAEKLAFYEWLKTRADVRVSKNGPGFLVSAIRKNFPPPKEFLREAKRSRQRPVPTEHAQVVKKRESFPREATVTANADQAVALYLEKLSVSELAALVDKAVAESSAVEQSSFARLKTHGGKLLTAMQDSLVAKHVLRHGLHVQPLSPTEVVSLTGDAEG